MSVPSTALLAGPVHQSQLSPADNKFHVGNGSDGKHYWLTPPDLYASLNAEFGPFDFDPCPWPKPEGFDGLTCEWGQRNYVNPPFGSIMHNGRKKGPTAWMRKAIEEQRKGKLSVVVYPVDKWVLMMLAATGAANVRNLGDVRWIATEDGSAGKGTGRHIAAFILYPANVSGHRRRLVRRTVERLVQLFHFVRSQRLSPENWCFCVEKGVFFGFGGHFGVFLVIFGRETGTFSHFLA